MRRLGLLVTALLTLLPACLSQRFNIGTPNACTDELMNRYKAFDLEQGINGYDGTGFDIATYKAHTNLVIVVRRYWQPYLEEKQALCGKLNRFGWYHTTWTEEQDWNNVVTPYGPFQQMLQDAVALGTNENEMVDCPSGHKGDCLELEVTPQKQFWTNRFFGRGASHYEVIDTKYDGITPLVGQNVCFYGPWVNDAAHGSRPEIHPTELAWWRDEASGQSAEHWYMIGITDDSDRFDKNSDFDLHSPVPVGWHPWAYRPYNPIFRIPFALDTFGASYHVGAYNTNTLNPVGSTDPTAVLNVNGKPLVTVNKPVPGDIVKVTFSSDQDTCADSNHQIHGYFDLQLQAGNSPKNAEGSFMLQVAKDPIPIAPMKDNPPHEDEEETEYVRGSLFATSTDHQRVLSGEFKLAGTGRTHFLTVQPEAVHKCKQQGGDCVSIVLLGASARTHPELLSAQVVATPPIALTYSRAAQAQAQPTQATRETNSDFVKALNVATLPSGIIPVRQNKQAVRIGFAYAAIKDGHPALEEDSPPVTDLNQALYQRKTKMHSDLFGAEIPFTIRDQQFTVFDETDHTKLTGGNARLYYEGGEWQIEANFPSAPADHLIRGEFIANASDAFGDAVKIDEQFWNGALQVVKEGKTFGDRLNAVAVLVGMDPKALDEAVQTTSAPGFPDLNEFRLHALAFRTRVKELLQDTDTLQYDDFLQLRNFAENVKRH